MTSHLDAEASDVAEAVASPVTIAVAEYPYTQSLVAGSVTTLSGLRLEPVSVKPIIAAFRRQIRDLEFDVCEVAITTYLIAREHGIPLMALPIFLNRKFHHGDMMCRPGSGILEPKDLNGRRVGVRAYSVTTGVWVRGILHERYGVDLDSITWLVDDEEHVESLRLPGNVQHVGSGASVAQMFHDGEIDAALSGRAGIGRTGAPSEAWDANTPTTATDAYALFPNAEPLQNEWFSDTGCYPIHGVLTVKRDTLERLPHLAEDLWAAFKTAKSEFLDRLADVADDDKDVARYRKQREVVGSDPLPFGIENNLASIETIVRFSRAQGLLAQQPQPEDVFLPFN